MGDATGPSMVRSLAAQAAAVLDDTTRKLGGAPPGGGAPDAVDGVAESADALVGTIGTYSPDDWKQDRGGSSAIEVLRSGIAEASTFVRQATAMTERSG